MCARAHSVGSQTTANVTDNGETGASVKVSAPPSHLSLARVFRARRGTHVSHNNKSVAVVSSHVSLTGCAYYYDLQVEFANLVKEQNGLANVQRPLGGDAGLSILDAADHNAR